MVRNTGRLATLHSGKADSLNLQASCDVAPGKECERTLNADLVSSCRVPGLCLYLRLIDSGSLLPALVMMFSNTSSILAMAASGW